MGDKTFEDNSWKDITQEFLDSVQLLNLGELLKTKEFTLSEAMCAMEMMDPRMDLGMVLKMSNREILNLEQSIKLGLVKTEGFQLDELIGIMDDTYACYVTWLEGHTLAQTVMTNLYLHEPERIVDRCMRVFSQSILKTVSFTEKLVETIFCIDEEDFQLNFGKFKLANELNEQKIMNSLEDLCQLYEKTLADRISGLKTNDQRDFNKEDNMENKTIQDERDHDIAQLNALIDRLRFTYHYYSCFMNLSRHLIKFNWNVTPKTDPHINKTVKSIQASVLICDQHLEKCLKYLKKWADTIDLGVKPEPRPCSSSESDYPTIKGFEPLINSKILPPSFPRCTSINTRPSTVNYLKNLVIRLRECISMSNTFNQKSYNKSMHTIEYLSRYFRPKSCVISRSLIQALYLPNQSTKLLEEELLQSITDYCEPVIQAMRKDEAINSRLNDFLKECVKCFSLMTIFYGYNMARQHERLPELIMNMKDLQLSALAVDNVSEKSIIYAWTTGQLIMLCIKYVKYGLELELFSPHEYPYVYWYLYDILYRKDKEQLETGKQAIIESQFNVDQELKKGAKGKKQRRKNLTITHCHDKLMICNDAFRFLTGGIFLLTYGLRSQGRIKSPWADANSEEICFNHRFNIITGTALHYQSYKQTLCELDKLGSIYNEALECFKEAKNIFTTIGQFDDCLKVSKMNLIMAQILASNSSTDRKVECSFDTHPHFPIVKFE